jgi:hypothetical protein
MFIYMFLYVLTQYFHFIQLSTFKKTIKTTIKNLFVLNF